MSDEKNTTPAAIDESMKALQDENTSLKNRVKELEADKSKAQKSLDDSLKAVGELSEQLELREKNNDGARIVKIGNKSYKILRSEEHSSELQSLMRISYAVFCLKKKKDNTKNN